ncbi:hypothetical protein RclHR1_03200013 [Rhizophagus clarus]|uniref:Attractin/MKLN-like beta-propeller domain-containing protein n=1 Tax=Rhizophagus clarus TaxID=94130 RepID=A0A2Z6R805_9GLOM|nr:hypothetical protein RclHR1_03200013 [Rhizophagus clarus]
MLFLCLIVICLYLNEFTLAFTPNNTVWGHSAVFADSRIYITGGYYPQNPINFTGAILSKEFYYLDVEKSFGVGATDTLPWVDLIYTYVISSQQWSNNSTTTNAPQFYYNSQGQTVCDVKTGKMYRFGGNRHLSGQINNNMDILDTSTLVWETGSTVNAPIGRYDHTGTLLSNGNIVYIGGCISYGEFASMTELPLYNTNNNTWTSITIPGYPDYYSPTPRAYHSAVLTQDGRIIVYGGYTINYNLHEVVTDDLVILDTSQPVYTWSKANVSTNSPLSRFYHTATLVGDYMIVIFGRNNIHIPPPTSNEVFILDTSDKSNYKWVSEFDLNTPPTTSSPTPSPTGSSNSSKPPTPSTAPSDLIGILITVVFALIGASFLIYRYRRRRLSRLDILTLISPQTN